MDILLNAVIVIFILRGRLVYEDHNYDIRLIGGKIFPYLVSSYIVELNYAVSVTISTVKFGIVFEGDLLRISLIRGVSVTITAFMNCGTLFEGNIMYN